MSPAFQISFYVVLQKTVKNPFFDIGRATAGKLDIQEAANTYFYFRSTWRSRIGTQDPKTQENWQMHRSLPKPEFIKSEKMEDYKIIPHPYDDAWIFHQPIGDSTRKLVYAKGKQAHKYEVAYLEDLEAENYSIHRVRPFKVFPVPGGAVIWHLSRNENDEIAPKLIHWNPDLTSH